MALLRRQRRHLNARKPFVQAMARFRASAPLPALLLGLLLAAAVPQRAEAAVQLEGGATPDGASPGSSGAAAGAADAADAPATMAGRFADFPTLWQYYEELFPSSLMVPTIRQMRGHTGEHEVLWQVRRRRLLLPAAGAAAAALAAFAAQQAYVCCCGHAAIAFGWSFWTARGRRLPPTPRRCRPPRAARSSSRTAAPTPRTTGGRPPPPAPTAWACQRSWRRRSRRWRADTQVRVAAAPGRVARRLRRRLRRRLGGSCTITPGAWALPLTAPPPPLPPAVLAMSANNTRGDHCMDWVSNYQDAVDIIHAFLNETG